jgi:magnesium transporter
MITIYRKNVSDEKLTELKKIETGTWINLINPTEEEIKEINEKTSAEIDLLKAAMDWDEKPRIEIEEKNILIIIKVPYLENGVTYTLPLGIVTTPKHIITIAASENLIISDFLESRVKTFFTTKKTRFCLQILARTNRNYQKYLNEIEKKIEELEKIITKSFRNEEIIQLLAIQKSLVYINTAVVSNEKVLEKITGGKVLKLYEEDEELLEDIIIDNKQSIDMVNIYSNILSNTMDAYASLISNNLNIVMKFLASVTIILAIPTIVASFYGMNVELPFEHAPNAFVIVFVICAALMGIAIYFFNKRNYF